MNSATFQAFKIQTVQTKTIIKMTPAQVQSLIQSAKKLPDQATPIHSIVWKGNTALRSEEKVCGLFNQEIAFDKDTGPLNKDIMININSNQNIKSTFAKRKSEANLHINLTTQSNCQTNQNDDEFNLNLDLDHWDLNELITPQTQKQCISFLNTMPSPIITSPTLKENIIKENDYELQAFDCINTSELYDNPKKNVFFDQLSDIELIETNECSTLDHAYSNKRKQSLDLDQNSFISQDSFSLQTSSPAPTTSDEPKKKKQRTKGIYRSKDVKTEQDYENYIERRKKNNISSKVSRSNKKSFYNSMEAKSNELENENEILKEKIQKLETTCKVLKEFLLQNFKQN